MTMDENVAKAVGRLDRSLSEWGICQSHWQTIRARLVELEAENERLRADRDSWCEQASQRIADWDCMRKRAEKAEELLREAIEWNCLDDDAPRPDVMDVLEQKITAHLSENGHG